MLGSSPHGFSSVNSNRSSCSGYHLECPTVRHHDMMAFPNRLGQVHAYLGLKNSIGLEGHRVDMQSCTHYFLCVYLFLTSTTSSYSMKVVFVKRSDLECMPGMWCTGMCLCLFQVQPVLNSTLCLAWFILAYR